MRKRKEGLIMNIINKAFLAGAKKSNSYISPVLKLSEKMNEPLIRKATIKTFENGNRLIDMDIVKAHKMKHTAIIGGAYVLTALITMLRNKE